MGATVGSNTQGGGYVNLQMWIGDPDDPTKGQTIENPLIDGFKVTENMFTFLPTLELHLQDDSQFFMRHPICIGDTLNIRLGPNDANGDAGGDDASVDFFKAQFSVQTVICDPDSDNGIYTYIIRGVYAADAMLNEIVVYPPHLNWFETKLWFQQTSGEAIKRVLDEGGGLGLSLECKPNDYTFWISSNETRQQFIERIIDHAWVGNDDAPICFTDVHGIMHYTSLRTLCAETPSLSFANIQGNIDANTPDSTPTITYGDARCLNGGGPVVNKGGLVIDYHLYNPWNLSKINWLDIQQYGKSGVSGAVDTVLSLLSGVKDRSEGHREKKYKLNDNFLATVSNKKASEKNNTIKFIDGGTYHYENHAHYNVAPKHNEMVRRSFFQNFVKLNIAVSQQGSVYREKAFRPYLGEIVNVDFSDTNLVDQVHSGAYCIAEISYLYQKGEPFTQSITVVNDGYYGKEVK